MSTWFLLTCSCRRICIRERIRQITHTAQISKVLIDLSGKVAGPWDRVPSRASQWAKSPIRPKSGAHAAHPLCERLKLCIIRQTLCQNTRSVGKLTYLCRRQKSYIDIQLFTGVPQFLQNFSPSLTEFPQLRQNFSAFWVSAFDEGSLLAFIVVLSFDTSGGAGVT